MPAQTSIVTTVRDATDVQIGGGCEFQRLFMPLNVLKLLLFSIVISRHFL